MRSKTADTVAKSERVTFSKRFRELRELAGRTQQDVADELGVSTMTVIRWERGDSEPSFTQICVVARMFDKTPNDFTTGDGEE